MAFRSIACTLLLFVLPVAALAENEPPPAASATEHMVLIPTGGGLPAFWIDVAEVSNEEYAEIREHSFPTVNGQLPITDVSWKKAELYCRARGKRLPTEEEWERAARGNDGRRYPWGDEFIPDRVNAGSRRHGPVSVGSYVTGASPFGVLHMAGNVWEWTATDEGNTKVYRGGSWASRPEEVRVTSRKVLGPAFSLSDLGFRCAMDAATVR